MKTKHYISRVCDSIDFQTVLEIGSGFGALTDQLLTDHAITKYISCDPNLEAVEYIQKTLYGKHTQLTTFPCKFENFVINDTKFDLVLAAHVLEPIDFNDTGNTIEILDKMCNAASRYIIHTCTDKELEKYSSYWKDKQNSWHVTKHEIDEVRHIFLAEII